LGELGGLPGAQKALSASRCVADRAPLHADEQAVGEVAFEFGAQDFVGGGLDVVLDAFELEALLVGVVQRVAGAVVVVARLADGADADDVFAIGLQFEVDRRQLLDRGLGEREHLAQVGVADQRDVAEFFENRQAFTRLLGGEDVFELFEPHGRAVAQVHADLVEFDLIGQALQPLHVLVGEQLRVGVERVARGLVVIRVVHAAGDSGVVVAEDRRFDQATHDVRALVRRAAVAHGVTEAVVLVDFFAFERFDNGTQRFVVGVDVAQDTEAHGEIFESNTLEREGKSASFPQCRPERLVRVHPDRGSGLFSDNLGGSRFGPSLWGSDRGAEGAGPGGRILVERDFQLKFFPIPPARKGLSLGVAGLLRACPDTRFRDDDQDRLSAAPRANPGLRDRLPRVCTARAQGGSGLHARDAAAPRPLRVPVARDDSRASRIGAVDRARSGLLFWRTRARPPGWLLARADDQRARLVGVLERRVSLVQSDRQRLRRDLWQHRARRTSLDAARLAGGTRVSGTTIGRVAAGSRRRIFLLLDSLRSARSRGRSAAREVARQRLRRHGVRPGRLRTGRPHAGFLKRFQCVFSASSPRLKRAGVSTDLSWASS